MVKIKGKAQLLILIATIMTLCIGHVPALANDTEIDPQKSGNNGKVIIKELYQQKFGVYDKELMKHLFTSSSHDNDSVSVINLPEQLLIYRNFPENSWMFYITGLIFTVDLTEKTEFTIFSEINIGSLSFGIINSDTDEVVLEYREIGNEDIKITLESGNYEFLLSGQLSNGTFEITSANEALE